MTKGTRVLAWVLVAVALSACADSSSTATSAVTDSAGVRIVTNLPGSIEAAEEWSLSTNAVVEIGAGADPDVPLHRVTAVAPLEDGRVAVSANSPARALVLAPDGTLLATLGREGNGPGEFSSVASVVPLGPDSLAVWDDSRRRISVFTGGGDYVREVDLSGLALLTPLAAGSSDQLAAWTYLLPSGSGSLLLFQIGIFGAPEPGIRRVEAPSYRITTAGQELARLGPFPGEEFFDFGPGQGGVVPFPFGADTHGATTDDALVLGTAEAPEIRYHTASGALERIVRWPDEDRTFGGPFVADWTEFVDSWLAPMPPGESEGIRGFLDATPRPERFPAYDDLVAADEGEIWVGAYAGEHTVPYPTRNARVPARRWLVFDTQGALAARVETPEGFLPHAVREGRVWGVYTDELEVESVRAYEIVQP
jgi:hypothetical protein